MNKTWFWLRLKLLTFSLYMLKFRVVTRIFSSWKRFGFTSVLDGIGMQMLFGFSDFDGLLRDDRRGGFFIFIRMEVWVADRIRMEFRLGERRGKGGEGRGGEGRGGEGRVNGARREIIIWKLLKKIESRLSLCSRCFRVVGYLNPNLDPITHAIDVTNEVIS